MKPGNCYSKAFMVKRHAGAVYIPAPQSGSPMTYAVNGKQYIVVPAGGGQSSKKPSGGVYVAYALP